MIKHALCRPPRGVKIIVALTPPKGRSPGRFVREQAKRPAPALAFLSESPGDKTHCTLWLVDCVCRGNPQCPRSRGLAYASGRYDTTNVITQPAARARRSGTNLPQRKP